LKDLQVDCIIGIYPHSAATQTVYLDINSTTTSPRATSDAIADAVDYDGIAAGVTRLMQESRVQLFETMAERAAAQLLADVPAATAVRIEVRKPAAVPAAACSFVRVERRR
jgi:dihydroneopterin aldolase